MKIKKIIIFLMISFSLLITGCLNNNECKHESIRLVIEKEASCTEEGFQYEECIKCHLKLKEEIVEKVDHNFENDECTVCYKKTSIELKFLLNDDNESYCVAGIGTCTDTDIIIPNTYNNLPVTKINNYAFENEQNITSIVLQNNITSIEDYAFYNCSNLTNIKFSSNLKSIGFYAFGLCQNLTNIELPNSLENISSSAFYEVETNIYNEYDNGYYLGNKDNPYLVLMRIKDCEVLRVELNPNVKVIASSVFMNQDLSNIEFPEGLTHICDSAFSYCGNLTTIILPNTVTSIGSSSFANCYNLTNVVLSNNLKIISSAAFERCQSLKNISIPESVTTINDDAFNGCSSLTSITIPLTVINVGSGVFSDNHDLTINCEVESKPETWSDLWCESKNNVIWNYKNRHFYKINYILGDGLLPDSAPTTYEAGIGVKLVNAIPNNPNYIFSHWADESGNIVKTVNGKSDITLTAVYANVSTPSWVYNSIEFDGKGMTYEIKVDNVNFFDPFSVNYCGSKQIVKQTNQLLVENSYNIKIKYSSYNESIITGAEHIKYINQMYLEGFDDVYVLYINSTWIPSLVKGGSLAELYDTNRSEGYFSSLTTSDKTGYEQNELINKATSVKGKIYGYMPGIVRSDYFMYYNTDKVKELGLEDPAELWMKGKWTIDNFNTWINEAQSKLNTGEYVLDMNYGKSLMGLVASTGNMIVSSNPPRLYLNNKQVTDKYVWLQTAYQNKLYNNRGEEDVSQEFIDGKTIFHDGELWYLKETTKFNPLEMNFTIGVVPYPTTNDEGGNVITTSNVNEAISLGENKYLTDDEGNYIKTIDMSDSTFKIPFTGTDCYSVINNFYSKNNITSEIVTHILNDLILPLQNDISYSKYNLQSNDLSYYEYLESRTYRDIDVEVIMSCQKSVYYEAMELISITTSKGYNFGDGSFFSLSSSIVKSNKNPVDSISEVISKYKSTMISLGYNIQ